MAGGPIFPSSVVYDGSSNVGPGVRVGAGSNAIREEGIAVVASLGANAVVHLVFPMPVGSLPSGTCKLRLLARAPATTGNAKVNPSWASCAAEEDPSGLTLTAEGTGTVSWGAGDTDQYKELEITLDADTPVADERIIMKLTFETSSWTLAQISHWIPMVVWE